MYCLCLYSQPTGETDQPPTKRFLELGALDPIKKQNKKNIAISVLVQLVCVCIKAWIDGRVKGGVALLC